MEAKFSTEIKYVESKASKSETTNTSESDVEDNHNPSANSGSSESEVAEPNESEEKMFPQKCFHKITWNQDVYDGYVLADNLHGQGFYLTHRNGQKFFFDGQFYMNKLEGYCQIFYENLTHFQGLFKEHLRYGPGVLSYPDGTQDAGFWHGFKLIRLACAVGSNIVPSLVSTRFGKTKILCSRFLVPLSNEDKETNLKYDNQIFNIHIRNSRSLFFHKKFYDEQFFEGQDGVIKVLNDNEECEEEMATTKSVSGKIDVAILERTEKLKNKIKEVNEFLKVYEEVKQNLESKIDACKECCKSLPEEKISEAFIESEPKFISEDTIELPKYTLDLSIGSSTFASAVTDFATDDIEPSIIYSAVDSLKHIKTDTLCPCEEEEEKINNLQTIEDQFNNVQAQYIFYKNIKSELEKKLNKLLIEELQQSNFKYKLVKIKELWAWNNEDSTTQMQIHCFKHRNSEHMVNFSVPNLVLGNRKEFASAGLHEETCCKFLLACSKGKLEFVKNFLINNKVHPNIADAKGNSAIFYAVAKNQLGIMKILTNFGAKLDQCNDEQLTPLSMSILKLIAIKNDVVDWERAFFPENKQSNLPELPKWYDIKSFLSITSISLLKSDIGSQESHKNDLTNDKIIDLYQRSITTEQERAPRLSKINNQQYIFNLDCITNNIQICTQNEIQKDFKSVFATISALLDHGANPNSCEVPYPPLVMAMFTESPDLIRELIKAKADVNITIEENLSCLHVVASLPTYCKTNTHIFMALLKYGCNPNVKTLPSHWADRVATYTGTIPENYQIEDAGKNALHLLCMRKDFELDIDDCICSLAKLLLESTLFDVNETYLGHTALSLAVLSGNIPLAIFLATSNRFNPYEPLSFGMGNILTVYALKRFENVLPLEQCKAMLGALFDAGVNLLNSVYDFENAIVFVEEGDKFFDGFIEQDPKEVRKGGKDKVKAKKLEKLSSPSVAIKEFMKILARQTMVKQIQMKSTEVLFEFIEEGLLEDFEICKILASEYLTPLIAIHNLKSLFECHAAAYDRLNFDYVKVLLDFVNFHKKVVKKVANKKRKESNKVERNLSEENMDILMQKFEITLNLKHLPNSFITMPGLDDPEIYNICYHCLRGKNKLLITCPRCQVIKFCSLQCNKLNNKLKTQHGCNLLFYDLAPEQILEITKGVRLDKLVQEVREKLTISFAEKRKIKLEEEKKKLLDMWKADIYGTKFLHLKPMLDNVLACSEIDMVKHLMEKHIQISPGDTSIYCLENLLTKLQSYQKSQTSTIQTKRSWSNRRSTIGGSTLLSAIFNVYDEDTTKKKVSALTSKTCKCSDSSKTHKTGKKGRTKIIPSEIRNTSLENTIIPELIGQHPVQDALIVKKLPRIPLRYQKFIEVIGQHFPEIDLSNWLLPYACSNSEGQLYYKFCTNMFRESYSSS